MKKKWSLFPMFILIVLISYKITPALAQQDKEILKIKKVIENYLGSFADLNSKMSQVSVNYFDIDKDGNAIDYAKFKSLSEDLIHTILKKYVDFSISNLEIIKSDFQENKATLEIEFSWKGYNLDTLKGESGKQKRLVSLVKEDNIWKIAKWSRLGQSKHRE